MKLKIFSLMIPLMALGYIPAIGQSQGQESSNKTPVSGKVIDTQQQPVPYSTVIFTDSNDPPQLFIALTDDLGHFAITIPFNRYTVEARCIGYLPAQLEAFTCADSQPVLLPDIIMEETSTTLNAAIVQANTMERRADRFIVNLSATPISQGRSLYESLRFLPGVTIRNGISINGKSGTRVMINNRMLNMSNEQIEQYLNNLRASDVQKIEIIPDAGAEYDANTTGGVIKITLKQQTVAGYHGSIFADVAQTMDYTQQSTPNFNFSFRKDRWSVITQASYVFYSQPDKFEETTQFYTTQMDVNNNNTTWAKANAASGEVSAVYDINPKQSIGIVANYALAKNTINTDGTSLTYTPGYIGRYINDNRQYSNYNRTGLSANYIQKIDSAGSTLTAMIDYLYNQSDNGGHYNTFFTLTPSTSGATPPYDTLAYRNNIASNNNIISANIDADIKWGDRRSFKAGGKFFRSRLDNDILYENLVGRQWNVNDKQSDQFTYTESVGALYATFSSSFAHRWLYTAGLRAEYTVVNLHSFKHQEETKQDYLILFPSVHLSYQENPQKGHSISLTANRKIERPRFSDLRPYSIPLNDFSYVLGNPELKPAKSINISLTQIFAHKYTLTAGASFVQDYFTQVVTERPDEPDILYYQFINLSNHTQWYASFYVPFPIFKWWTVTPGVVGLYIKDNYNTGGGNQSNHTPAVMGTIASNFILPKGWKPEFDGSYLTGVVQGNMTTGNIYSLNIGCTKSFLSDKLTATLRINNLVHQRLKITTTSDTYKTVISNDIDLRALYISLRYSFNSVQRVQVKKATTGVEEEKARF